MPLDAPTKPCHNCRRQRLRCDRSYPHCNKCLSAGKECLGYGNLFRWTGAVASRGKLAGKTSSAPDAPDTSYHACMSTNHQRKKSKGGHEQDPGLFGDTARTDLVPLGHNQIQLFQPNGLHSGTVQQPWVLVDPLFQDMEPSYRFYLSYFTTRLCKDLVSHDLPDRNPFRSLIPLTRCQPLLQHVIVAASAAHLSNLISPPIPQFQDGQSVYPDCSDPSKIAFRDALVAKHKALRLMHSALQDIESYGGDVVLATALFFVNVELIESGKEGWRAHLEGAGRIMSLLQPDSPTDPALRDYMVSDCLIYYILGSAFAPRSASTQSFFESSTILSNLHKAAENSYVCCPPEVLEILYTAASLANRPAENDEESDRLAAAGLGLIRKAEVFDIPTWARSICTIPAFKNVPLKSRIHAGSANNLAARLYTLQAIPCLNELLGRDTANTLSDEIVAHLEQIPDDDSNFKATTWPTFIVGAQSTDPQRRVWVMDRLQRLLVSTPWGFISTAMEALQVIWGLDGSESGTGGTWVEKLKDASLNFLIV